MNAVDLNYLLKKVRVVKIERDIYFVCMILFFITISINVISIMYYPYLFNGLILEINILLFLVCCFLFRKTQKMIGILEDKRIELKVKYILNNRRKDQAIV